MAFLFPSGPTVGQRFTPVGGPTYIWTGSTWDATGAAIDLTPYQKMGPAFDSFTLNTQATGGGYTYTLIPYNGIAYNLGSCYNNTNATATLNGLSVPAYSFCPNIPGYYAFNMGVVLTGAGASIKAALYKNGTLWRNGAPGGIVSGSAFNTGAEISNVLYLNGTGDYVAGYVVCSAATQTIQSGGDIYFQGYMARGV